MRKTYDITVCGQRFQLRLTLAGQKALKEKYPDEESMDTIISAIPDPEKLASVLDAALRWNGNDNPKEINGEALYDMLVDDGYAGHKDFCKLSLNIAANSGLIDPKQHAAISSKLLKALDETIPEEEDPLPDPPQSLANP